MKDFREQQDDFSAWCDMWDKACEKKIFPETPKLDPMPESDEDFDDAVGDYYNNIDREAAEEGLLHEDVSPNPVYPDSIGKDSRIDTKTSWVDERPLEALADLKRKLYDVECKLNAKDAGGTKWNSKGNKAFEVNDKALWKQIHTLKEKVDELSNNLGFKDDPEVSLYKTQYRTNERTRR